MKRHLLLLSALALALAGRAQTVDENARPGKGASVHRLELTAGTYHSSFPVLGVPRLFYQTPHPGATVAYERSLQIKGKHAWVLRGRAGFFYHRFIQSAVPVSVEGVYQHGIKLSPWLYEVGLGLGYLHSVPLTYVYKQQDDGSYRQVYKAGRPQGMVTLAPGISYGFGENRDFRLFFRYQLLLQTPFVAGFVPVLPYNSVQLGASLKLNFRDEE